MQTNGTLFQGFTFFSLKQKIGWNLWASQNKSMKNLTKISFGPFILFKSKSGLQF